MERVRRPLPPLPAPSPLAPPEGFAARLASVGATLDDAKLRALGDYLARLLAVNEQMNLTAVTEPDVAWERHLLDALTLVPLLDEVPAGARLVDVGSGGGIPGLPLAIARPDIDVVLVESTQKKAAFLEAVAEALGLANVTVRAERAEQLLRGQLAGAFEVVTARAVARLAALVPLTVPFLAPGGLALLVKGQRAEEELAEAGPLLARHRATHERTVPTPTGRIVVLRRAAR